MLRSLYRLYLYGIIIILLYFTAIATTILLATLLGMTPLNGSVSHQLTSSQIVQPAVFTIIAWIITLGVGGFHYWLLRRDEASDPLTANGAVRAFLVNVAEGVAALTALIGGVLGLSIISNGSSASVAFATFFVFAALFVLFELERRRQPAQRGAALVFQRLHFAGLQLIFLLFFLVPSLINTLNQTLYLVLFKLGVLTETCNTYTIYTNVPQQDCYINGLNSSVDFGMLPWLWLSLGLVVLAWVGYWRLLRQDRPANLVRVFHFLGFASGVIVALYALERAIELLLRLIRGVSTTGEDLAGSFNFISPLLTGLLIIGVYVLWLRGDRVRAVETSRATWLTGLAVTAGLAALPFWIGCTTLLDGLSERAVPGGNNFSLIPSLALALTGILYIPLELWLRAGSRRADATPAPGRALRFGLLALGVLDAVISLVVLLYAVLTAALGNPLNDWQQSARSAGSALLIGLVITLVYGWPIVAEQRHHIGQPAAIPALEQTATTQLVAQTGAPVFSVSLVSIEGVLDELLAGRLTRDQAATSLHQLMAP